ncbi:hypothetical protein Droror1_Dr00002998 [Drosera rotundifolia]
MLLQRTMAPSPPLIISIEWVSMSNWKGGGERGWRHDCGAVSCASKTTGVLTGSLATTTGSRSSYSLHSFGFLSRNGLWVCGLSRFSRVWLRKIDAGVDVSCANIVVCCGGWI